MLSVFTVCFFGHRHIEDYRLAEARTEALIRRLIAEKEYVEFLVGRDGDYDQIVSSAIRRTQRDLWAENSAHVCVLPYPKQNMANFASCYDEIEICEASAAAHPKAAFLVRNRCMVDRSDLCVFFVARQTGGAWETMRYAIQQGKTSTNCAQCVKKGSFYDL